MRERYRSNVDVALRASLTEAEARASFDLGTTISPSEAKMAMPNQSPQTPRRRFSGIAMIIPASRVISRLIRMAAMAWSTPTTPMRLSSQKVDAE